MRDVVNLLRITFATVLSSNIVLRLALCRRRRKKLSLWKCGGLTCSHRHSYILINKCSLYLCFHFKLRTDKQTNTNGAQECGTVFIVSWVRHC
jgi:hypothetical protein